MEGFAMYDKHGVLLEKLLEKHTTSSSYSPVLRIAQLGVHEGKCTAMWGTILSNWLQNNPGSSCEFFAIDRFQNQSEKGPDLFQKAMMNLMPLINREYHPKLDVRIIRNDPVAQANEYPDDCFDIVYVDGTTHYIHMIAELKAWTKKIKMGGLLCGVSVIAGGPVSVHVQNSQRFRDFIQLSEQTWYATRCLAPRKQRPLRGFFIDENELEKIDLQGGKKYMSWSKSHEEYITHPPGMENYKMFASIARQLPNGSLVVELGTSTGSNTLSLAYNNPHIKVLTFDYENNFLKKPKDAQSILDLKNVEFQNCNGADHYKKFLSSSLIIVDMEPHDGLQEEILVENLANEGYKGIVIFDDISLNVNMKYFWDSVTLKKIDLTRFGHWSGVGAVIFDPSHLDIVVQE